MVNGQTEEMLYEFCATIKEPRQDVQNVLHYRPSRYVFLGEEILPENRDTMRTSDGVLFQLKSIKCLCLDVAIIKD